MKTPFIPQILGALCISLVMVSCSKKEDFSGQEDQQIEEINIGLTYRKASLRDQPIAFQVFDEEGNEITENISFFVDGEPLVSDTFQSSEAGTHEIYAEYELNGTIYTTDAENFSIVIPKRKVVMEDYTGLWCGYCPSMDAAINEVAANTSHYTAIAIHNNDEYALSIEPIIRNEFEVFAFPSGRINRTQSWGSTINFPAEDALDYAGNDNPIGIAINPQMNESSLNVKVSVASEDGLENKRMVVYLLEDGLIGDQTNYFNEDPDSPYFGMGNPIENFELNHVLRASLSDPFGDAIPSTAALTDYETTYTYSVPSEFTVENLSVVVMIVEADNTAVNSQYAHVNEASYYE